MTIISIDGVDLPTPSVFRIPKYDIDSSGTTRNELGVLQRDRVRQGIYKIELEWRAITSSKLHLIESAIEPVAMNVRFLSPTGYLTKKMYVGDRNIDMVLLNEKIDDIRWTIRFNLVEY